MNIVPYPDAAGAVHCLLPQPYTIEHEAKLFIWLSLQTQGAVLEIGCANGYLTRALAHANTGRTVYALDWAANANLSIHQEAERPDIVASRALSYPNVVAINGDSKRVGYPPGLGLIIVDGDHTPEGVEADTVKVLAYRDSADPKPIVAWHDYRGESQWMGVYPLLNGLADRGLPLVLVEGTPIVVLGWPA